MSNAVTNLTAVKWRCGRCGKWNNMDKGLCGQCKAPQSPTADAFRLHNVLTNEEENFYHGTAPYILQELKAIRQLMESLVQEIQEWRLKK